MSKQTATEWLFKKLWDEPKDKLTWYAILNQAEEMFEEQIIDACNQIEIIGLDSELPGEKYYNKTFKD
jgi:DNA-binding ferritin-like protein (Dps family)